MTAPYTRFAELERARHEQDAREDCPECHGRGFCSRRRCNPDWNDDDPADREVFEDR